MTDVLALSNVVVRFGAVTALSDASISVRPGTVHALLGENGAGKTTLMRVAYGMQRPDAGRLTIDGQVVTLHSPSDAMRYGIGMVHQHFTLVPAMSVAENVALGMRGPYNARHSAERVRVVGQRTGLLLDPTARVGDLPVGAQQRLEIVKALARDARVLILDEPTAVLAPAEADELLQWVRRFCDMGHSAVLITHKLREAIRVADDVTVLRRGTTVAAGLVRHFDETTMVHAMLGDELPSPPTRLPAPELGGVVLALRGVSVGNARGAEVLRDVTLEIRRGEIVGIAAVEGSGQRELLRLLAGRLDVARGTIVKPSDIAFIPEDRHHDALVLDMSLVENVALRGLDARRGRMPWNQLRAVTTATLNTFDVRASGGDAVARTLSGGNQQKLVVGRELASRPSLVVAENPTRGLDIRATAAVHNHLREARTAGSAVLVYSSDLDEVLALADRMIVVHAGRVRAVERSRDAIGRAMLGAE